MYEEMTNDFASWLRKVIVPFGILSAENTIGDLADKYKNAFTVDHEDVRAHKRKITPGDYKEKLKSETIKKLNTMYHSVLQKLGYEI